ncbi:MAG: T9SS type A sorting domain-containing protein [Candidatus Kapaibacteriales bacterium]
MAHSQFDFAPIDTVFLFSPGKGQNVGQDSIYFPNNVFNLPRKEVSDKVPESNPENICSLGIGGEIIVGWKNYELVDAEGFDFTIFENAFINPATKKVFAEPAIVSCSEDGVNFITFPYNLTTLEGCAGTRPTNGSANPFDPSLSGGNAFDLSSIGLSKIRYIKIKDICDSLLADKNHPFYDPLISGFDLDCVVGLHLLPIQTNIPELVNKFNVKKYPKKILLEINEENAIASLYDEFGQLVRQFRMSNFYEFEFSDFFNSIYFLIVNFKNSVFIVKILKYDDDLLIFH